MSETNTKQKIFETMYQLIAKKGYDKTSTAQIADIIGIKKSSIYYYFKSKEDIFLQIAIGLYKPDYYKRFTLLSNSISAESYKENLILAGEEYIDSYFENPELRKVIAEIDIQTTRIPALMEFVKK
ncbi:MAG: TetR/AcrR family transcriptional regulator, partial [Oscillospiraceae bacterium]